MESNKSKRRRAAALIARVPDEELDNLLWVLQQYAAPVLNRA